MMKVPEYVINLDLPPYQRWSFLREFKDEIDQLLECYLNDFEGAEYIYELIPNYRDLFISETYKKEIDFISSISRFSSEEVLVANLYYDILKSYFGCTAFAFDNGKNLYHGRNLDWHTDNNILSKYTSIFDFQKGGKTIFKSIGWKGFVGVLSGIKPKKFSITLNAILSNDKSEIAYPISLFIRDTLENIETFEHAKAELEKKEIASDCLLLLSGIKKNEFVVIERTPKRYASRISKTNSIVVTNDYKKIENVLDESKESILSQTSCGRYDRTNFLLNEKDIKNSSDCMDVLKDEKVQMGITVQQMVFENRFGEIRIEKTGGNIK